MIRWSLSETLSDSGHVVREAGDGASALRTLTAEQDRFDVVVLDYNLPDSHDLALLSAILQQAPQVAVIMMTAFGTSEMADGAHRIGAYRVVPKPFEMHDMAKLVLEAYASRP